MSLLSVSAFSVENVRLELGNRGLSALTAKKKLWEKYDKKKSKEQAKK